MRLMVHSHCQSARPRQAHVGDKMSRENIENRGIRQCEHTTSPYPVIVHVASDVNDTDLGRLRTPARCGSAHSRSPNTPSQSCRRHSNTSHSYWGTLSTQHNVSLNATASSSHHTMRKNQRVTVSDILCSYLDQLLLLVS